MVKDALNDRFIGDTTFKYVVPTFIQSCTNLIYMSNTLKTLKEVVFSNGFKSSPRISDSFSLSKVVRLCGLYVIFAVSISSVSCP